MQDLVSESAVEYQSQSKIIYPDSDGQRMADNTKQFEWIATIKGNLDAVFKDKTDVFVAGDLLWYPVEGEPRIRVAPDVMVAFGRPKGHRGSYKQWEEANIAPQVVFEILSPGNNALEMIRKERFYNRYGIQEYYVYDPDTNRLLISQRQEDDNLKDVTLAEDNIEWFSPLLQVKFVLEEKEELKIFDASGKPFLTYVERAEAEQAALEALEAERRMKEEAQREKEEAQKAKEEETKARLEEEKVYEEKLAEVEKLKILLQKAGLDLEE